MGVIRPTRVPAWIVAVSVAITGVLMLQVPTASAAPPDHAKGRGTASFEERHLDLEEDWGEATVCLVHDGGDTTECFRTVEEADAAQERIDREAERESRSSTSDIEAVAPSADGGYRLQAAYAYSSGSCGSWLSLSDGTYDTGRTLRFRDRGYVQDLANYGFAYATSSYTTGGCSVTMYDGGWSVYPGNTSAWTDANWMQWGWDNRVRRIYIH